MRSPFCSRITWASAHAEAMALAASPMFGVLSRTAEAGAGEMLLVEAQEEFRRRAGPVPQPLWEWPMRRHFVTLDVFTDRCSPAIPRRVPDANG
jgi:hypothetical protein